MRHPFAQLVVRTPWSFLRGASTLADLAAAAARRGVAAMAVADRGGLCAAVEAWDALVRAGVRPILGAEVEGCDGRAVLLARDGEGYASLCGAVSATSLDPAASIARTLAGRSSGLFVLASEPPMLRALAAAVPRAGLRIAVRDVDHARILAPLGHELGLRPVAVGDVHFASPGGLAIHRALRAVARRETLGAVPEETMAPPGAWMAGPAEMRRRFSALPEALDEAAAIAARCRLDLPRYLGFGARHFPPSPGVHVLPPLLDLERRSRGGLEQRLGTATPRHRRRLQRELRVIGDLGYASYFLVLADLVDHARRHDIAHWGRGSAAGSLVAFALGLTPVDPLAHGLLFERFLNPARRDLPDVDIDLDWRRRDEVIAYLARRHGADRVARLGTHVAFGPRGAVRELGKVVGVPAEVLGRLIRAMPPTARPLSPGALRRAAEVAGLPIDRAPLPWVLDTAAVLQSFPHHRGLHPTGVLVAPRPLADWIPLARTAQGHVATQWAMGAVERAGLVKLDLLGNRALAAIDMASSVALREGAPDPRTVDPCEDAATRDLIRRGETMACFHVESPAIRSLLRRMAPRNLQEVVVASSVVRPGVAGSGMLEEFLARREGRGRSLAHPALAEILADTHGVMVHQEDVMVVAHRLAGMTLAEADELRRALTRRAHRHRLPSLRRRFLSGSRDRGLAADAAREIWRQVESFAGYAFCKAHSASFAALSYRAAYLRAHHPAVWMAAVLSQRGGYYGPAAYISECVRMGLRIARPCVNRSEVAFSAEGLTVRVGLMQVRGLPAASARALVEDRERGGPFASLEDLSGRLSLRRRETEALIRCGALDDLADGRTWEDLLWCASGGAPASAPRTPSRPSGPGALIAELETLGLGVSGHPLDLFLPLQRGRRDRASDLPDRAGRPVRLAAWRVAHKPLQTRGGRAMELLSFEDETAQYEAAVFPDVYARVAAALQGPGPFWIRGRVCEDRRDPLVVVTGIEPMEVPDAGSIPSAGRRALRPGPGGPGPGGVPQRLAGG